ncbi:MAG: HYExAFE family protein [Bacteroidales bacterium]|nr:HYExAFE family protein [Bacteroidales bacterium]
MDRTNPYEVAFAAFLRERRVGFVPVDEAKRSQLDPVPIKSPDFVVVGPGSARLVVDVKGRRFPGGSPAQPRMVWQNWSTTDDITGLHAWAERFGPGYRGVLVFVYRITPPYALPPETLDAWSYRQVQYLFRAVDVRDYRQHMRTRSPRWGTVHLATADFRKLVRPFSAFLTDAPTRNPSEKVIECQSECDA